MTTPDPRALAESIILSHTEDIEWGSIGEMTQDDADEAGLTEDQHEALCHEIDDLISKAVVTVSWPDLCGRKLATGSCPEHDPESEAK